MKISVHKHSAGVGAGIVRVRPTLKFHISGALTLRDTLRIFLKFFLQNPQKNPEIFF